MPVTKCPGSRGTSDVRLPDPLKLALDVGVIIMESISLAPVLSPFLDFPTAVGPAFTFVRKYVWRSPSDITN